MPKSDLSNRERKRNSSKKQFDHSGQYSNKHIRQQMIIMEKKTISNKLKV